MNNFLTDPIQDEVGDALKRVKESEKGSHEHRDARKSLEQTLRNHGFDIFMGRHESMPISRVGDSAIVEVGTRRGQLAKYHGKTLRLAIAGRGAGSNGRIFAAKEL
jgi:hypothetical protein